MASQPPPAGWYADPHDPARWRWWDGAAWTDQFAPMQATAPAGAAALWEASTLWIASKTGVGTWSAIVQDEAGTPVGSVRRTGNEVHLLDASGSLQLVLHADLSGGASGPIVFGDRLPWLHVHDATDRPLGTLAVTRSLNRRLWLSLRAGDDELAVLEAEGEGLTNWKQNAIRDASGKRVAQVHLARESGLLTPDLTWWLSIDRPLPQPLDSLVLAAGTALEVIQDTVMVPD